MLKYLSSFNIDTLQLSVEIHNFKAEHTLNTSALWTLWHANCEHNRWQIGQGADSDFPFLKLYSCHYFYVLLHFDESNKRCVFVINCLSISFIGLSISHFASRIWLGERGRDLWACDSLSNVSNSLAIWQERNSQLPGLATSRISHTVVNSCWNSFFLSLLKEIMLCVFVYDRPFI